MKTFKEVPEEISDNFIRHNNEIKALKLAYQELKTKINNELVKARREDPHYVSARQAVLLGRKHCALLVRLLEEPLSDCDFDVSDFDPYDDKKSQLKMWSLPIYISMEDDEMVKIISLFGSLDHVDYMAGRGFFGEKPLVDMDALIEKLPDNKKFKRVYPIKKEA